MAAKGEVRFARIKSKNFSATSFSGFAQANPKGIQERLDRPKIVFANSGDDEWLAPSRLRGEKFFLFKRETKFQRYATSLFFEKRTIKEGYPLPHKI